MKQAVLLGFALVIGVSSLGLAETGKAPDPAAVERGLALYTNNCQQCHQKSGTGETIPEGIRDPDFLPAIPLDEKAHAWHHGDDQLVQIIQRGNRRMPPFANTLSEARIRDVIAYMKSLWSPGILSCQGPKHMNCM